MDISSLQERVASPERRARRLSILLGSIVVGVRLLAVVAWTQAQPGILRARGLIIVDSLGRERLLLGAPIPEAPGRIAVATGLALRDTAGAQRFGFGIYPNGMVGMGFDAPRGVGDDRARERINIAVDSSGGAQIRFLNRKSSVAGYMVLGRDDNMWIQFHGRTEQENLFRRIGVLTGGDTTVRTPRSR